MSARTVRKIRVFEVGPRDGLQNEGTPLSVEQRAGYVARLVDAGARDIEIGAFVREDRVPQMSGSGELFEFLRNKGIVASDLLRLWALVPNRKGLQNALSAGCRSIALFTGATNTFTQKNIGMTVAESLREFELVCAEAKRHRLKVRAYVSVCWGCPYEGDVSQKAVVDITKKLIAMGVWQVSLGDTIGVAAPKQVQALLKPIRKLCQADKVAVHFHDTRGTALANVLTALPFGVKTIDAASGGLGGCNYAPGASGNLATEDLVYMLEQMGVRTGINLAKLAEASAYVASILGKPSPSKYVQAVLRSPASTSLE